MITTTGVVLSEMYEHAMPAAPPGRGVAEAPEVTTVGAGRVTPSALPTVEAEGHEPVLMAAALVAGAEVGAVDPGVAVAPLEEEAGVAEEEPQAASAATATSPPSSDGRVIRWDMECEPPLVSGLRRRSQVDLTSG
jgi:hypothetical protein